MSSLLKKLNYFKNFLLVIILAILLFFENIIMAEEGGEGQQEYKLTTEAG